MSATVLCTFTGLDQLLRGFWQVAKLSLQTRSVLSTALIARELHCSVVYLSVSRVPPDGTVQDLVVVQTKLTCNNRDLPVDCYLSQNKYTFCLLIVCVCLPIRFCSFSWDMLWKAISEGDNFIISVLLYLILGKHCLACRYNEAVFS